MSLLLEKIQRGQYVLLQLTAWLITNSVVLSSWTRMLDAIEVALNTSCFTFARIDGTKSEPRRRIALDCFRNEKSCTILLASLGSIGVG